MPSYVISDIHGEYDKFNELLDIIGLGSEDTLYVLGDILDRGPHPIKTVLKLMEMPNAVCIVGNHEVMALTCLRLLVLEITEDSLSNLDEYMLENMMTWQYNGSSTTINEFKKLDPEQREAVLEFLEDLPLYEEVTAGGKKYLLVHAGLGNYSPEKELGRYTLNEMVWFRADYSTDYFPDVITVTGHTPTRFIESNPEPDRIYRKNNHIAIDCGACLPGGRLAALCLDTGEEFYTKD